MKRITYTLIFTVSIVLFIFAGCTEEINDKPPTDPENIAKVNSCEGCHTNYEHLKANYTPDPPAGPGHGCGGDPPHYEPYDRVFLGGTGYTQFQNTMHGKLGCVTCHNGVEGTSDRMEAHSGDFINKPSHESEEKCGSCHPNIVNRTTNSLHEQGWGQKNMVVKRGGYGDHPTDFENCPENLKEGYNDNCMTCHGTCGECHIVRPKVMGGGLTSGHNFIKTPDMRNVCVGCHVSRGGHAYFGVAAGTKPDVHLTQAGFTCMGCHTQDEIHGDGNIYETRYQMPLLPKCENCHSGLQTSNVFHSMHINSFNCYTCHSQDYNNCGSCHIGTSDGARIPSHMKFKIALNPIPDIKPYRMATVRESLSAPDSWDHYGVPDLVNFDAAPTYKYTSPHNILRWTTRTTVDTVYDASHPACAQACHIVKLADGSFKNKEFYLFNSDLYDWEIDADKDIVCDGQLPASWGVN